jgi:hypothetical protein
LFLGPRFTRSRLIPGRLSRVRERSSAVRWSERKERGADLRGWVYMRIEFLHGRPLSPEELEIIRRQIEGGFEVIAAVDDEIRGIVARNWPHLLSKLPPEED